MDTGHMGTIHMHHNWVRRVCISRSADRSAGAADGVSVCRKTAEEMIRVASGD